MPIYQIIDFDCLDDWEDAEETKVDKHEDHTDAAEKFAEEKWADWDYPSEFDLAVRVKGEDHCRRVKVTAERTVTFRSREIS